MSETTQKTGLQITSFVREWANQDAEYEKAEGVGTWFEVFVHERQVWTKHFLVKAMVNAMSPYVSIDTIGRAIIALNENLDGVAWLSIDTGETWEPSQTGSEVWVKAFDPAEMWT